MSAIVAVNPAALTCGTDLPNMRAPVPFSEADRNLVIETLGNGLGRRVLFDNAFEILFSPIPVRAQSERSGSYIPS
jgi:hypothetical protein